MGSAIGRGSDGGNEFKRGAFEQQVVVLAGTNKCHDPRQNSMHV